MLRSAFLAFWPGLLLVVVTIVGFLFLQERGREAAAAQVVQTIPQY